MGIIWSRFRKKLSTKDVLEEIEKKLKSIEEFQLDTLERKKRVAWWLVAVTVIVYVVAILAFLVVGTVRKNQIYLYSGLIIFAILVWSAHRLLRWHYTRRMRKNAEKSVELRKKKQKILEDVMDTETYKVAKEILDKYGDKTAQKVEVLRAPGPSPYGSGQRPPQPQPVQQAPGLELRQRHPESAKFIPARTNAATVPSQPPSAPNNLANNTASTRMPQQAQQPVQRPVAMNYGHAPLRRLPRPILPRERGVVDRVVDFFVGDGPNQRYALICRHCNGHNGMALQEEFEYVSFYCCYCFQFNPARKQRFVGPRLPVAQAPLQPASGSVVGLSKGTGGPPSVSSAPPSASETNAESSTSDDEAETGSTAARDDEDVAAEDVAAEDVAAEDVAAEDFAVEEAAAKDAAAAAEDPSSSDDAQSPTPPPADETSENMDVDITEVDNQSTISTSADEANPSLR